jgi:ribosomal protein L40E
MLLIGIFLATALLIAVLHWWAEGVIEASDGLILVVLFGGLIIGLFSARNVYEFLLAFVPLIATGIYLVYAHRVGGLKAYLKRQCEEYIRAITFDPRNTGARECLARALYELGELDRAIDEMQVAVAMGAGIEAQHSLDRWIKERHIRDSTKPICRWCMAENQPGERVCSRCGAELPVQSPLLRILMGGRGARTRYYLILIFGLGVLCISLILLPLKYAWLSIVLFLLVIIGWSLLSSARGW